jgi:uncharacterized protein YjbI with pentapeptide repeats
MICWCLGRAAQLETVGRLVSKCGNVKYSEQEIENEIQGYTNKPPVYEKHGYPYHKLTDRQFEALLYFIFRKDIEARVFSEQFDDVSLMAGVGEQGRDCGLYYRHKSVGIVQCKHSINPIDRLDKPSVAQEIIKFTLHYLSNRSPSLIDDPSNFTYYIAVSADFSGPAIDLLCNFNQRIVNEEKFQDWVDKVIGSYQAFQEFTFETIKDDLCEILQSITVRRINASDLNLKLTDYQNLISHFFSVKMVISVEDFRKETERDKKKELILQMASTSNSIATEAVRLLRAQGWLQDGTLETADLSGANLQNVDLSNANLVSTKMKETNLRGAKLYGVDFRDADLRNVDLTDAQGLTDEQLGQVNSLLGATMVSGKRYNGRFNFDMDLLEAHLSRTGRSAQAMANFYGVSVENYEWGQEWNRFWQSPPIMYSPDLEKWSRLVESPDAIPNDIKM